MLQELAAQPQAALAGKVTLSPDAHTQPPACILLHYLAREADGCLTLCAAAARAAARPDGTARVLVYLSEALEDGGPDGSGTGDDS